MICSRTKETKEDAMTKIRIKTDALKDRESLSTALVVMAFLGIIFKNVLFWAFIYGPNYYETNFVAGLQKGLPHLYISFSVVALVCSFALLMRKNGSRFVYLLAIDAVYTVIGLLYVCYLRYFSDLPSVKMVSVISFESGDMPTDPKNATVPLVFADVLFIIDFIVIYFVWFWKSRLGNFSYGERSFAKNSIEKAGFVGKSKKRAEGARKCAFIAVSVITAICLFAVPLDFAARGAASAEYKAVYGSAFARDKAAALSPIGYLADDIAKNLFDNGKISKEDEKLVEDYFEWNRGNYAPSEYTGKFAGKNFIFLQLESVEDFVIGNSIDGQEITPTLNSLLSKSYYFHNIKDRVTCGNSSDCDTMVMASMAPSNGIATFNFYARNRFMSMPQLFLKNGYDTAYYMGAGDSIWNYPEMMENGIRFEGADFDFDKSKKINTYISDESILKQAMDKMEARGFLTSDKPFYAHITLCNSHAPFIMPEELEELKLSDALAANAMGDYLQAVHYVDGVLGRFLAEAETRGFLDNTVLLFTGDHRGIHKYYPFEINKLSDADYKDWMGRNNDASLPIILYDPTMPDGEARMFEAYGTQIDVMPTVMDLFGVPHEQFADTAMGRSLFSPAFNATVDGNGEFYNNPSETDKEYMLSSFKVANIIYKSDYFKDKLPPPPPLRRPNETGRNGNN